MLGGSLLTDECFVSANNSTLPANLTIQVINNQSWYNSPLLGVIVGAVVVFLFNILYSRLQEKTELKRYEYNLLTRTKDLLDRNLNDKTKKEIEDFIDEIYRDLRFPKIISSKYIANALLKALKGNDNSEERTEIDKRIEKLIKSSKRGIL